MKVSCVAETSPFKQAMLSPEECYIVDGGNGSIFVWKGVNGPGGILLDLCSNAASEAAAMAALVPVGWTLLGFLLDRGVRGFRVKGN